MKKQIQQRLMYISLKDMKYNQEINNHMATKGNL